MKRRIKTKICKRALLKLAFYRRKEDPRSFYEIAKKDGILSPKEKAVFLAEEERWMRMTQKAIDEIDGEDAKKLYQSHQKEVDPDGFKLFRAAQDILGKFGYSHFPYEDNLGFFEAADGFTMLRYLLVQYCRKLGNLNANISRWEIACPGYEKCINLTISDTPEYRAFENKLYIKILQQEERLWDNALKSTSDIMSETKKG